MNKISIFVATLLLSACSLDLEDVRLREASCRAEKGNIIKNISVKGSVESVQCEVDGVRYTVMPSGNLK